MVKKNAKEYLIANGLNDIIVKKVVRAAENNISLDTVIPSKWRYNKGALILTHIDPLMHLIFYGVASSTMEEIQKFLIQREKHGQFKKLINELLPKVINLKLSWCKLMPYKEGTFGGWIAENWIAFVRIIKWINPLIARIAKNQTYVKPDKDIKHWTKKELSQWCKWHGFSAGKKKNCLNMFVKS